MFTVDQFQLESGEPPKFKRLSLDTKFVDIAVTKKTLLLLNGKSNLVLLTLLRDRKGRSLPSQLGCSTYPVKLTEAVILNFLDVYQRGISK